MSPVVEKYPTLTIPKTDDSFNFSPWPYVYTEAALFVNMYNWGMDQENSGNFIRWQIGKSNFGATKIISNSKGHMNAPFFGPKKPGNTIFLFGGRSEHDFM